jgi:glycosyltransferase involved in cell wall biosynthesis
MDSEKTKIFVSAYACEPGLGSEIGVGWHWVLEMSKYFELWVLTRKSNQNNIESWMKHQNESYDIHFVYFDLPKALRFWKKGMHGVRTYYTIWQTLTNRIVKKTMQENNIKIYHLLTYGNSLWKASRYGMKQFFIWGPTGGVDTIPAEYSKHYETKSRLVEFVRRLIVKMLPFNYGFNKRCKNADLIFCKSYNMYNAIPKKYRDNAMLFTDVAVELKDYNQKSQKQKSNNTRYIVVGKLDAWRAFDVLVEAFAKAHMVNPNIELEIVGKGADWDRIKSLIKDKKMEKSIHMCGKVDMDEYFEKMNNADVIVNSSLKEGAVTVSFDSMALSKPLICVDTGGYTRYFSNDYAIVLERNKREQLIDEMEAAILKMTDEKLREEYGRKAYEAGVKYTWDFKGKEIYEKITKAYRRVNSGKANK